jgi:hypothetical protein
MKPDSDDDEDKAVGSITFGGLDTDNCAKDYTFVDLRSKAVWWFTADAVAVGGKPRDAGNFVVSFLT